MKRLTTKIFALALVSSLALTGCGSTKIKNKTINDKLQDTVKSYYDKNKFIGTVLVAKDNKILLEAGYGMADNENNIKNTPQNIFPISSLTLQFTAVSILMLQEKNLLNMQDTIDKYIPDYPNGNKIKIFNLLTHTSGIHEYLDYVSYSGTKKYTPLQLIELVKNKPLVSEPGKTFDFTNTNYILLGYIIEKVSGKKYEDYVNENILKPLKMDNTGFLSIQPDVKGKAVGYLSNNVQNNKFVYTRTTGLDPAVRYASGEMYSTVDDMYKWYEGLASERVIKKASLDQMFTSYSDFNYGLGFFVKKSNDGSARAYASGTNIPGYTSFNEMNMKKNYTIIILCNQYANSVPVNSMAADLQKIVE